MWVPRLLALLPLAIYVAACGGKSISTVGGEAGAGSCEETLCDGDCVDTSSDRRNCGSCGRRCREGELCSGGACLFTPTCEPPEASCNGQCVDLRFSQDNCGGCGIACGFGAACQNGVCVAQCTSGQCGGRCVDFANDPANCGGCGITCGPSQICSGGRCFSVCEGASCNGVCVDLASDPFNCGSCGSTCLEPGSTCISGFCQSVCPPDSLFCSGVCVDWRFDPSNCGGCGYRCAMGQQCSNGSCVNPCPMGSLCGGECVDLSNNPNHCGGCFASCGPASSCFGGSCVTGTCGDRVRQSSEEADPPPGPLSIVPLDPRTCRYDFSRITQWYCNGSCGNWGGATGCDQLDADAFCKLKMDNPRSTAVNFSVVQARPEPGVCCPPPEYEPGSLGCTSLGVLSSRGVELAVSVHPSNLFSTHQGGRVVTDLVCTDP